MALDYAAKGFEANDAPFSIMIYKIAKAQGMGAAGSEGGAYKLHVALVMPQDRGAEFEEIISSVNAQRKFAGIMTSDKVEVKPSRVGLYADVPCMIRRGGEDSALLLMKLARGSAKMRGHKATADKVVDAFLAALQNGMEVDQAFASAHKEPVGDAPAKAVVKAATAKTAPAGQGSQLTEAEQAKLSAVLKDLQVKATAPTPIPAPAPSSAVVADCPSCREPVESSWVRCPNCGTGLAAPPEPAPAPAPPPAEPKPTKPKKGADILKNIKAIYEQVLQVESTGEPRKDAVRESRDLLEQAVKAYQEKDFEMAAALTLEATNAVNALKAASKASPAAALAPEEIPAAAAAPPPVAPAPVAPPPAVPAPAAASAPPPPEWARPALVALPVQRSIPADSPFLDQEGSVQLEAVLAHLKKLKI